MEHLERNDSEINFSTLRLCDRFLSRFDFSTNLFIGIWCSIENLNYVFDQIQIVSQDL